MIPAFGALERRPRHDERYHEGRRLWPPEALLFDDWFDAIEDGVRTRVRGFIETMLEAELSEALSRPRYGRRRPGRTRRRCRLSACATGIASGR